MAANMLVNVPKLRGRENYDEWAFAAENYLILEGLEKSIKKESTTSVDEDARTRAKLIMTIDPSLYVHIKGPMTTKSLWDKLKNMFDDSGFTRRISLLRNLISVRLEDCENMTSYVTQIIEAGQKLSGTGFHVNDEWIGSLMLAGLPEKYAPMLMAIEHSGIAISSDIIKTKLLDMCGSEESTSGGALATRGWSQWQNRACKSEKLQKRNGQLNNDKQVSKSNYKKQNVKCYKCKQFGHYRNQCPFVEKCAKVNVQMNENAFSASFLNGNYGKNDWYVDSGASSHMTANPEWILNGSESSCNSEKQIIVANDNKLPVVCCGNVQITTKTDEERDIIIHDVLCVPQLTTNLLSVSKLIEKGNKVKFSNEDCKIYNQRNHLVATAELINGVYKLNLKPNIKAVSMAAVSLETWHRRLGHVNNDYMRRMTNAVTGMLLDNHKIDNSKMSCTVCCEGKQCRLPFKNIGHRSKDVLNIIHTDICGPMENVSIGGSRYFILFVDDFSRMTTVYFLKHKSESLKVFKEYKIKVENQQGKRIQILRSDNGREFCNTEFDNYLNCVGIIHQRTNPYTPEQNGLSERFNRTIVEKARCLLFDANLGKQFWAEATNTAVYLKNLTISSGLDGKTPYEVWTGNKPDIEHLRIFGSTVMVHIPKEKRRKWDKKSESGILIGYPENIKGYRIYFPRTKTITTSRNVIIIEKDMKTDCTIEVIKVNTDSVGEKCKVEKSNAQSSDNFVSDFSDECSTPISIEEKSLKEQINTRPVRTIKKTERYGFTNMCVNNFVFDDDAGLSLNEALAGPEKDRWLEAMDTELQCFHDSNAWELVDPPSDGTIVQCKWVLRKKVDSDNKVRYRARLVAKGYTQKPGIDYNETFSPVVRHTTLRLLFALSVQLDLDILHLDVTTAFLNGDLEEVIYMQKPEGFKNENSDGKVLKLMKAIYGLKQSSRAWYKKVDSCLMKMGYNRSILEPCLYVKNVNKLKTIVALYVDDFLIFSNSSNETEYLKTNLLLEFKLKDLGQVKQFLGMTVNVNRSEKYVTLSQENYIDQLLTKFNMIDCNTVDTPMQVKLDLGKSEGCVKDIPYQQLIGSLMYLSVLTRPDITFSVGYLSQFNNCYSNEHWQYAKRLLKYLKRTKNVCIKYNLNGNSTLEGYVDADWASNSLDRKSYTGFCFLLFGGVISWESRKQKTVALSSTEAEYMGIAEACREATYLRNLYFEITGDIHTIVLYNDSQSAQKLANGNSVVHKRSKHIDVKFHFCRDCIHNKFVELKYLPTADMPADLLTKSLCSKKHVLFLKCLGLL